MTSFRSAGGLAYLSFVIAVFLVCSIGVRRAAMNPHAITAADGFTGLECLWFHARQAETQDAVVPREPFRWEIRMLRRDKDRGATGLFASGKTRGEISPWKPRDRKIIFALA